MINFFTDGGLSLPVAAALVLARVLAGGGVVLQLPGGVTDVVSAPGLAVVSMVRVTLKTIRTQNRLYLNFNLIILSTLSSILCSLSSPEVSASLSALRASCCSA